MPCPFETVASGAKSSMSLFNLSASKAHASAVAAHKAAVAAAAVSTSHQLLSEHLKHATSDAHRRVESSEGVRRLMGFASSSSSSSSSSSASSKHDGDNFGRLDYVRWMIMLGCIYAALESALQSQEAADATMLHPLMQAQLPNTSSSSSLLRQIYRFPAIVEDVNTHLKELSAGTGNAEGEGLSSTELLDSLDETRSHLDLCTRLANSVAVPQKAAAVDTGMSITDDQLRLLTYSQAESTLIYVERIGAIVRAQPDLLLSHAYVRYLGDLSGGQHIKRRIQKLFPVEESTSQKSGFAFYSFAAPAGVAETEWHMDLKNAFRRAMDQGIDSTLAAHGPYGGELQKLKLTQRLLELQGSEASLAFELNTDLFEGLIGAPPQAFVPSLDAGSYAYQSTIRPPYYSTETADTTMTTNSSVSPAESEVDPNDVGDSRKHAFSTILDVMRSSSKARRSTSLTPTLSPLLPRLTAISSSAMSDLSQKVKISLPAFPTTVTEHCDRLGLTQFTEQIKTLTSTDLTVETLSSLLVGTLLGASVMALSISMILPLMRGNGDLDAY